MVQWWTVVNTVMNFYLLYIIWSLVSSRQSWLFEKGLAAWREFVSGHYLHMHNTRTLTFIPFCLIFLTLLPTWRLLCVTTKFWLQNVYIYIYIYIYTHILGQKIQAKSSTLYIYIYIKVKWSRYRPGVAQRVGRGIALLFHDRGTRRGWVVSSTPRPQFTRGKDPVPILQEAGWAPGPVWMGGKSRAHRDSIPDRSARSQSLYRLSYPAHLYIYIYIYVKDIAWISWPKVKVECYNGW